MKSAIVHCFEEAEEALQGGLLYPILCVPHGAEGGGILCRVVKMGELTEKVFEELLESAYPLRGKRAVHLLSKAIDPGLLRKQEEVPFCGVWPSDPFELL